VGIEVAVTVVMKKTRKLVLDIAKVRELLAPDLERANGGYFHPVASSWCSSAGAQKCTYGCAGASALCVNR